MWPLIVYGNRRQFISAITQRCASYTWEKHPIHLVRYAEVAGDLRGAAIRAIWEAMLACMVVRKASHKTVSYDYPPRHPCAPITYRSVWMNKGVDWESQCAREMEIEGDDGGFSKSRFEMRPVVSDQPGKRGRGWPLPIPIDIASRKLNPSCKTKQYLAANGRQYCSAIHLLRLLLISFESLSLFILVTLSRTCTDNCFKTLLKSVLTSTSDTGECPEMKVSDFSFYSV